MINLAQIRNLLSAGLFDRLIDRVLSNGRCGNPMLRLRLTEAGSAEPAALGLALQRACELAYRPGPLHRAIADRLMRLQRADGGFVGVTNHLGSPGNQHSEGGIDQVGRSFGSHDHGSVAAAAVAVRGLLGFQDLRRQANLPDDPEVDLAVDRGLRHFSQRLTSGSGIGRDAVDDAIVLWQLGAAEAFREVVRIDDLIERIAADGRNIPLPDLRRLALAAAA